MIISLNEQQAIATGYAYSIASPTLLRGTIEFLYSPKIYVKQKAGIVRQKKPRCMSEEADPSWAAARARSRCVYVAMGRRNIQTPSTSTNDDTAEFLVAYGPGTVRRTFLVQQVFPKGLQR
ncbi:hypothetical protein NX059_008024 [Plenodomus lindquistii]|nr:hypothetical protein NX059_008024 [Plenodomus lindquistii]